ncbi:hypothetical protein [Piscinibacter sakaiensis]|uniref:hypothetical protein n=1 Tax=Piscinibacter sakaiensis TaxID=1547922 RepID=UPI003AAE0656
MPDQNNLAVLLLGLIAPLLVAAYGFYRWRHRVGPVGFAPSDDSRRKAAETLWTILEDVNFRMRETACASRQRTQQRLREVNAVFVQQARHLDHRDRACVRSYLASLHRVAALLRDTDSAPIIEWVDSATLPIAGGDARLLSALQDLARQRESVKRALLKVAPGE